MHNRQSFENDCTATTELEKTTDSLGVGPSTSSTPLKIHLFGSVSEKKLSRPRGLIFGYDVA